MILAGSGATTLVAVAAVLRNHCCEKKAKLFMMNSFIKKKAAEYQDYAITGRRPG